MSVPENELLDQGSQCYCNGKLTTSDLIQCQKCKKWFHAGCLKSGCPSSLVGDTYFTLICSGCGDETCTRQQMTWLNAIWLALHNLSQTSIGKRGYFHWKDAVCMFIDHHWTTLFGTERRKNQQWHPCVAGVLSTHCPQYFMSGQSDLGEPGYWMATANKPPWSKIKKGRRKGTTVSKMPADTSLEPGTTRSKRPCTSPLEAAMQRKALQSEFQNPKKWRRNDASKLHEDSKPVEKEKVEQGSVTDSTEMIVEPNKVGNKEETNNLPEENVKDVFLSVEEEPSDISIKEEPSDSFPSQAYQVPLPSQPDAGSLLGSLGYSDSDLEVDPVAMSPSSVEEIPQTDDQLPAMQDLLRNLQDQSPRESFNRKEEGEERDKVNLSKVKKEPVEANCIKSHADEPSTSVLKMTMHVVNTEPGEAEEIGGHDNWSESVHSSTVPSAVSSISGDGPESFEDEEEEEKAVKHDKKDYLSERAEVKPSLHRMSLYEEKMLLQRVLKLDRYVTDNVPFIQLKRKLLVRQEKRQHNQNVFDLDKKIKEFQPNFSSQEEILHQSLPLSPGHSRILDRYQNQEYASGQQMSFRTRLVGLEDEQLQSHISPYTSRILKPFIRRDYECLPQKLKLLRDIQSYPNRNNQTWCPPSRAPIDYCYVRPQHIASVNALCRQFFWPGIDLSECLQYPDFSVVVLYRQLVIGFAFMVPDVKYNEAYISFLFTHPEWRRAGIAKFMIYHLIQTCMGKDVTLHVSATNPALLLYQKFGFKPQEFILNFYEKYFPAESTECRHAFFLRLQR